MVTLTLYTNNYPFGESETFLETEINFLSLHFKEIIIVPFSGSGRKRIVPANVIVLSPIQTKKWQRLNIYIAGILNFYLIHKIPELRKGLRRYPYYKCLKYLGFGIITKNRILKLLPSISIIHYSYWLNFSAFALSLLKREGEIGTIISRAHRYDLYDELGENSLTFIKSASLKYLNKLLLISEHGRNYLVKTYPEFEDKYFVSRLGTKDPEFINPIPGAKCLTLVSCSAINPNKRINLIFESLSIFKTKYPQIEIVWHHLGSGSDIQKYIEKANRKFKKSSVRCIFQGSLTNLEVFEFYRNNPINLFINVSESEGIPVSIMEAQSCSIPVVATNVGGNSEIVNDENGILLSPNPLPEEIADIFYKAYQQKTLWKKKRINSRIFWENNYSADRNYNTFSNDILSLI